MLREKRVASWGMVWWILDPATRLEDRANTAHSVPSRSSLEFAQLEDELWQLMLCRTFEAGDAGILLKRSRTALACIANPAIALHGSDTGFVGKRQ